MLPDSLTIPTRFAAGNPTLDPSKCKAAQLGPSEVHLWFNQFEISQYPLQRQQYWPLLSEQEKRQQMRFHFIKDQQRYLLTRALVRTVLSIYCPEVSPQDWQFGKNAHGKPYSLTTSSVPLSFNLSHTGDMIVLGISLAPHLGVDLERVHSLDSLSDLAQNVLSPQELQRFEGLPLPQQISYFFDIWTLKEAYIKACGRGLSIPLKQLCFAGSPNAPITITFAGDHQSARPWRFWQARVNHEYYLALATEHAASSKLSITTFYTTPGEGFQQQQSIALT